METLQKILDARGLSASDVSRLTGLRPSTVCRHLRGERTVSAASALQYARVLELPLEVILGCEKN